MDKGWTDAKIAEALDCRTKTVENVRKRFVEAGFEQTLERKKRTTPPVVSPERLSNWKSHRPSASRADAQKNNMNTKRNLDYWVIPPAANAEFAAQMEML